MVCRRPSLHCATGLFAWHEMVFGKDTPSDPSSPTEDEDAEDEEVNVIENDDDEGVNDGRHCGIRMSMMTRRTL